MPDPRVTERTERTTYRCPRQSACGLTDTPRVDLLEIFVALLVVAGVVGAVMWNWKNAAEATDGVEFTVSSAPESVAAALRQAYCAGAKAAAKSMITGLTVTAVDRSSFRAESRLGDRSVIEVTPDGGAGSVVRARTMELYVGSPPATQFRSGLLAVTSAMTHAIYKVIGICPNAARMKRFQRGVEGRLAKELRRAARP